MRTPLLWLSLLGFIVTGVVAGGMAGVYGAFFILQILQAFIARLTGIGLGAVILLLMLGVTIGAHGFVLLWMLAVRPFAHRGEVQAVVSAGLAWFPERWLLRKLYPDETGR